MNYTDLRTDSDTRSVLGKLRSGQIRGFRSASLHGDGMSTPIGFYCTADQDSVREVHGIDPRRIDGSIFRADRPIDARITYGIQVFDCTNDAPGGPDWRTYPKGRQPVNGTAPYPAALVYGDAKVTPDPLSVRMYWGRAGQTADEFRAELLALLQSNER